MRAALVLVALAARRRGEVAVDAGGSTRVEGPQERAPLFREHAPQAAAQPCVIDVEPGNATNATRLAAANASKDSRAARRIEIAAGLQSQNRKFREDLGSEDALLEVDRIGRGGTQGAQASEKAGASGGGRDAARAWHSYTSPASLHLAVLALLAFVSACCSWLYALLCSCVARPRPARCLVTVHRLEDLDGDVLYLTAETKPAGAGRLQHAQLRGARWVPLLGRPETLLVELDAAELALCLFAPGERTLDLPGKAAGKPMFLGAADLRVEEDVLAATEGEAWDVRSTYRFPVCSPGGAALGLLECSLYAAPSPAFASALGSQRALPLPFLRAAEDAWRRAGRPAQRLEVLATLMSGELWLVPELASDPPLLRQFVVQQKRSGRWFWVWSHDGRVEGQMPVKSILAVRDFELTKKRVEECKLPKDPVAFCVTFVSGLVDGGKEQQVRLAVLPGDWLRTRSVWQLGLELLADAVREEEALDQEQQQLRRDARGDTMQERTPLVRSDTLADMTPASALKQAVHFPDTEARRGSETGYKTTRSGYETGRSGAETGRSGYETGRSGDDTGRSGHSSARSGYTSGASGRDPRPGALHLPTFERSGTVSERGRFDRANARSTMGLASPWATLSPGSSPNASPSASPRLGGAAPARRSERARTDEGRPNSAFRKFREDTRQQVADAISSGQMRLSSSDSSSVDLDPERT